MERAALRQLLRATGCAIERGKFIFLCDPNWTVAERADAERQIAAADTAEIDDHFGWLCVRTGGSGGQVKFARHDEKTLGTAAKGFCAHFKMTRVNAIDVLPAHHISGLMARVRSAATGGQHLAWEWKRMEAGETPALPEGDWVLSVVPTQLQRLLGSPPTVAWLRRLKIIFVGGGPLWPELAEAAVAAQLRVSPGYGMTETAAMVTALLPEEFLAGARSSGTVMPHARVSVRAADGVVSVTGDSVFRGYWPEMNTTREFVTEDLGRLNERGHLHVLGRRDAVIITGGKKVQPGDVEAVLRASGEFEDVAVLGFPDREWGAVVVACYPANAARPPNMAIVQEVIDRELPGYQRPKRFVAVAAWPRNSQGKINRAVLRATVLAEQKTAR
jgi:O-succinylbenzoic acid--CoA ligase